MNEARIIEIVSLLNSGAGLISLFIAPAAMIVAKGSDIHRTLGKIFFYGMAIVTVTAVILSILEPNLIMAMLAMFSFHLIASGYRSLYHKKLHEGQRATQWDWVLQGSALVLYGGLLLWGVAHRVLKDADKHGTIFLIFGAIGLLLVLINVRRFFKKSHDKQEWLYGHMAGFLLGYVATVCAFSVLKLQFIEPAIVRWLWPFALGVPLIIIWVQYYQKRYVNGKRPQHEMTIRIKGKKG